jgi:CRISPR/Cas system-associated protein endoribonuclease Cas2
MEAIRSTETSVQSTTSIRRHTPEDGILHSHRRENLKSYGFKFISFSVRPGIVKHLDPMKKKLDNAKPNL